MSKKNKVPTKQSPENPVIQPPTRNETIPELNDSSMKTGLFDKLTTGWVPYILFAIFGIVLYANTFNHEFALDDDLVICRNDYVLKGVAGLGDIMFNDIFDAYNKQLNAEANLAGGRYRPFSVATYAIEQQFIGTKPEGYKPDSWDVNNNKQGDVNEDVNKDGLYNDIDVNVKGMSFRHVNNVLCYILGISVIFLFLSRFIFKENKLLALLISLLFMAHPLHTEVVANVKSRDEILSLLFIMLTMFYSFKYYEEKTRKNLLLACVCFMTALLSKEYGVSLLIIIPVSMYIYFKKMKFSEITMLLVGLGITFFIYYAIRSSAVIGIGESAKQDTELLNNPFLYASAAQAWATKVFINLKYFGLMLFPYKLSCDYSYNTIPFRTFSDPAVLLTILIFIASGIFTLICIRKRNWLAFPLLFIFIHLLLINNFLFNIGATMGERLVYHSSLGVCILVVYGCYYLLTKVMKLNQGLVLLVILPLIILGSIKTIARNPAWKNNITLYTTDVKTYPNSTMLNGNACLSLFDMSNMPVNANRVKGLLDSANAYGLKALQMHPGYFYTHINLGLIKAKQGDMDSAAYHWLKARELSPYERQIPPLLDNAAAKFYNKGMGLYNENKLAEALVQFQKSNKISPKDHRPLYFIGMIYSKTGDFAKAKKVWMEAITYAPNDSVLQNALKGVANY